MRHLKKGRKFGLKRGKRKAFLKLLAYNFIKHEKINTTEARAKELRMLVERFVTYGKKQNLSGLRLLIKKLPKEMAYKMFYEVAPKYKNRNGGYTRIIKHSEKRVGDAAKTATIEFV